MMMKIFIEKSPDFQWIDITAPTNEELKVFSKDYGFPDGLVEDCLDTLHLPKAELLGKASFFILRILDGNLNDDDVHMRQMTTKIAVFLSENYIITIHRIEHPFLGQLAEQHRKSEQGNGFGTSIFLKIFLNVVQSYQDELNKMIDKLEGFEDSLFDTDRSLSRSLSLSQPVYYIQQRSFVFERLLSLMGDLIQKLTEVPDSMKTDSQNAREHVQQALFSARSLVENTKSLLELNLSLHSQQTNEVMRVLTIFSIFFLPLTFVVGIYGMNFESMPEIKWEFGYAAVLSVLAVVPVLIYIWLKRKKWL